MIKKLSTIITVFGFMAIILGAVYVPTVSAQTPAAANKAPTVDPSCSTSFFGIPTWYEYLTVTKDATGCNIQTTSAAGGGMNIAVLILLAVVDILVHIAGLVAVGFVVYGGFQFVISQGEPGKIVSARKTILNAVIGLGIAILSSQIVKFVAKFLSTTVS
jgi:hypothetical protein